MSVGGYTQHHTQSGHRQDHRASPPVDVLLCVEPFNAAQGQEAPAAASSGFQQGQVGSSRALWRTVGLWGGLDRCQHLLPLQGRFSEPDPVSELKRMGPASLQEEREPRSEAGEEMESYHCLLQASSQLESTVQREYEPHPHLQSPTVTAAHGRALRSCTSCTTQSSLRTAPCFFSILLLFHFPQLG